MKVTFELTARAPQLDGKCAASCTAHEIVGAAYTLGRDTRTFEVDAATKAGSALLIGLADNNLLDDYFRVRILHADYDSEYPIVLWENLLALPTSDLSSDDLHALKREDQRDWYGPLSAVGQDAPAFVQAVANITERIGTYYPDLKYDIFACILKGEWALSYGGGETFFVFGLPNPVARNSLRKAPARGVIRYLDHVAQWASDLEIIDTLADRYLVASENTIDFGGPLGLKSLSLKVIYDRQEYPDWGSYFPIDLASSSDAKTPYQALQGFYRTAWSDGEWVGSVAAFRLEAELVNRVGDKLRLVAEFNTTNRAGVVLRLYYGVTHLKTVTLDAFFIYEAFQTLADFMSLITAVDNSTNTAFDTGSDDVPDQIKAIITDHSAVLTLKKDDNTSIFMRYGFTDLGRYVTHPSLPAYSFTVWRGGIDTTKEIGEFFTVQEAVEYALEINPDRRKWRVVYR